MSEDEEALHAAVKAHPRESTPRLVLADYYDDAGESLKALFHRHLGSYSKADKEGTEEAIHEYVRRSDNPHEAALRLSQLAKGETDKTGPMFLHSDTATAVDSAHAAEYRKHNAPLSADHHRSTRGLHRYVMSSHDQHARRYEGVDPDLAAKHRQAADAHKLAYDAHHIVIQSLPGG